MDNPVFVFGSFSEDEASYFQYASASLVQRDRQPLGSISLDLKKKGENFCESNAAVGASINGDLKSGDDADLGISVGSSESKHETLNGPCNGGANISSIKQLSGNLTPSNKETSVVEPFNRVNGLENVSLKHVELHAESNVATQQLNTPQSVVSSDPEYSVPLTKGLGGRWADLQEDETSVSSQVASNGISFEDNTKMQATQLSGDLWLKSLNEAEMAAKRLQPRGLVNNGNLCFLNATLQALVSCSPFVHLLHTLQAPGIPEVGYPTIRAFVNFFREFEFEQYHDGSAKDLFTAGKPFVPSMFDSILHQFNPRQPTTGSARSRQEDAQEFLTFTMDHLHDELISLDGKKQNIVVAGNGTALQADEEDDWETVGPKNRTAVVRTHKFFKSALSDIFGGELCSIVKSKGSKASATVQPFLVLHLDILPEAVHTVEDALRFFAAPETLEGYRATTGKAGVVSASKSVKLQSLPRVLILHLKRFSYGAQGSSKLHKPLHFPLNLTLGRDLLSNVSSGSEPRNYELVATVTHHGKDPWRGHYTAHSKQLNGQWLRYDDGIVQTVGVSRVLQDLVYLLFYKRSVNIR